MSFADLPRQLLLDGGMGTQLMSQGLNVRSETSASWNLRQPEQVLAAHRAFVEAGAGAVQTNSFVANRLLMELLPGPPLSKGELAELNLAACRLAREAVGTGLVIGSMGPSGHVPPPQGDADLILLEEVFAEQAAALQAGGVDFLHIETMAHPKEMRAALRGCRQGAPALAVVASMTCKVQGRDLKTTMGFGWESMLAVALEEKADGVGINCTMTPAQMAPLVEELVGRVDCPVFAKPTIAPDGGAPLYPEEFATGVVELFSLGARAVGGCCGTGPDDIAGAALALGLLQR